ncbi:hypothetical protein ADL32_19050 [Streptomyces albidoflavus]|uniref:hypothetical protein n=1 Tax=Streptomyces albidoflavus TaxID=1886 RepID=UPI0007442B26|nr:hypothetical protein [Streptomyces albidoflavus]KUL59668.1 hypothetical protein ADL32_19050 [Streptomyces albidoflavus]
MAAHERPRAPELPPWVWDLVIALQRYEDEHDKDAPCLNSVLAAVPFDVRDQATVIRRYVQQAQQSHAEEVVAARIERMWGDIGDVLRPG